MLGLPGIDLVAGGPVDGGTPIVGDFGPGPLQRVPEARGAGALGRDLFVDLREPGLEGDGLSAEAFERLIGEVDRRPMTSKAVVERFAFGRQGGLFRAQARLVGLVVAQLGRRPVGLVPLGRETLPLVEALAVLVALLRDGPGPVGQAAGVGKVNGGGERRRAQSNGKHHGDPLAGRPREGVIVEGAGLTGPRGTPSARSSRCR